MKIAEIGDVLGEALRAVPWMIRSQSQGTATSSRDLVVMASPGGLVLAAIDRESGDMIDSVEYAALEDLEASADRVVAWAACVARLLAGGGDSATIADTIPAPALLVEPSLVTEVDFERARLDVDLEEACVARLRHAATGESP